MQTTYPKPKESFKEFLELNKYSPASIYKYSLYESLLPKDINQVTINKFINAHNTQFIRSFLNLYLYDYLNIDDKEIKLPRYVSIHKKLPNPKEILYLEEIKKVLSETRELDVQLAVRLGFVPGLRISEMVGDTWENGYITPITPSSIDWTRLTVFGTGKGNKDYIQPINTETVKLLKLYITKYKLKDNDRFFDMTRQTLLRMVQDECEDIIGKHIIVHSLRSSLGTYLVECSWHPIKIKEYLRHLRLETILKYVVLARNYVNEELKKTELLSI